MAYFVATCAPVMPKPHMTVSYRYADFEAMSTESGRYRYGTSVHVSCDDGYLPYRHNAVNYNNRLNFCGGLWSGAWNYPVEKFQCVNSSLGEYFYRCGSRGQGPAPSPLVLRLQN